MGLSRLMTALMRSTQWISMMVLFLMMCFMTAATVLQNMGYPVKGDNEVTASLMVVLVAFSFSYAQYTNSHITVDILKNRMPQQVQRAIELIGNLVVFVISIVCSMIFMKTTYGYLYEFTVRTDTLNIPFYILALSLCLGYFVWAIAALASIVQGLRGGESS